LNLHRKNPTRDWRESRVKPEERSSLTLIATFPRRGRFPFKTLRAKQMIFRANLAYRSVQSPGAAHRLSLTLITGLVGDLASVPVISPPKRHKLRLTTCG
jgi:hypothetical protein